MDKTELEQLENWIINMVASMNELMLKDSVPKKKGFQIFKHLLGILCRLLWCPVNRGKSVGILRSLHEIRILNYFLHGLAEGIYNLIRRILRKCHKEKLTEDHIQSLLLGRRDIRKQLVPFPIYIFYVL